MFKRIALVSVIVALSYLSTGCGVRPQVDFYVNPIATGEEQKIDEKTGSVIAEEAGVKITVSAVDTVELLKVTSAAYINPYIYVSDWGAAKPRYTVFDVTIKNDRESKVSFDPAGAVLMDEQGEQYEVIPYEAFMERYEAYPRLEREIIYHPSPYMYYRPSYYRRGWWRYPGYYHYDRYYWERRPYYVREVYDAAYFRKAVVKGTLLREVKLYPGGKRQGFLIFPALPPGAGELRLIIPGITIYHEDEKRRIEFQFHFEQTPAAVKSEE